MTDNINPNKGEKYSTVNQINSNLEDPGNSTKEPIGKKWKKWNRSGYDNTPGQLPPDKDTIAYDSDNTIIGNSKSEVLLKLQSSLQESGVNIFDSSLGIVAWKNLKNEQVEAKWLSYEPFESNNQSSTSAINPALPNEVSSISPTSNTINDQIGEADEDIAIKENGESVLSNKEELIEELNSSDEDLSPSININLEAELPEISQESAVQSNQTTLNTLNSSIDNSSVESNSESSINDISNEIGESSINDISNEATESSISDISNTTSDTTISDISNTTSETAINDISNESNESLINDISNATSETAINSGSTLDTLNSQIDQNIQNSTEGNQNLSVTQSELNTPSVTENTNKNTEVNNNLESSENKNISTTASQSSVNSLNFTDTLSNSNETETSTQSSVNNLENTESTTESVESYNTSEDIDRSNSSVNSNELTNVTVDRKNMEVLRSAEPSEINQNNSQQSANNTSNSNFSESQATSNTSDSSLVQTNESSTNNSQSSPQSSTPMSEAQVTNNTSSIDISQLVNSISRLERILLSGIDVTLKDN